MNRIESLKNSGFQISKTNTSSSQSYPQACFKHSDPQGLYTKRINNRLRAAWGVDSWRLAIASRPKLSLTLTGSPIPAERKWSSTTRVGSLAKPASQNTQASL